MEIKAKTNCPLNGFQPCKELDCAWFMKVSGKHPQSEDRIVEEWGCSMAWLPILMIENSQQQRATGKAVDEFKNEMVKANQLGQQVLLATVRQNGTQVLEVQK